MRRLILVVLLLSACSMSADPPVDPTVARQFIIGHWREPGGWEIKFTPDGYFIMDGVADQYTVSDDGTRIVMPYNSFRFTVTDTTFRMVLDPPERIYTRLSSTVTLTPADEAAITDMKRRRGLTP